MNVNRRIENLLDASNATSLDHTAVQQYNASTSIAKAANATSTILPETQSTVTGQALPASNEAVSQRLIDTSSNVSWAVLERHLLSRRKFNAAAAFAALCAAAGMTPEEGRASVLLPIMLPTALAGLVSILVAKSSEQLSLKIEEMRMRAEAERTARNETFTLKLEEMRMRVEADRAARNEAFMLRLKQFEVESQLASAALASGNIEVYKLHMTSASRLFSRDVDNFGTQVAAIGEDVVLKRSGVGGPVTGGEMKALAPVYSDPDLAAPVPLEDYSPQVDPKTGSDAVAAISNSLGMRPAEFKERFIHREGRRFVTKSRGGSQVMLAVLGKDQKQVSHQGTMRTPVITWVVPVKA